MDIVLAQYPCDQLVPLYEKTDDKDLAFIREISWRVSSQHASLFAEPKYVKGLICWHTDGHNAVPLQSLPQAQQQQIIKVIQSILVDIASVARLCPKNEWSRNFCFNSCFPSLDYVYVVDGRPVITGWGYAGNNGFYDPLDKEITKVKKQAQSLFWSHFPWVTALIALFTGVAMSLLWHISQYSDKICYATYPLVTEVDEVISKQQQNKELNKKRENLLTSLESLQTQCKVPPITTEQPKKSTELLKPRPIDLPKESWNKKEVSMLDGCWNLTTPLTLRSKQTRKIIPVKTWQVCFNEAGDGNQTITMVNGMTCKGPLAAHFQGTQIILEQPKNCIGDFTLIKGSHTCTRTNDREASCLYKDNDQGNSRGSLGIFKR